MLAHLKKNLLLLSFWILLFAIVTGTISIKYGIPYSFLDPEYLYQAIEQLKLLIGN